MSIQNVNLVMFSPCGGTADVIRAIARDITLPVREYDITLPKNRSKPLTFTSDDLVILGFPVYEGRMPANIDELLATISGDRLPAPWWRYMAIALVKAGCWTCIRLQFQKISSQ